MRRISVQLPKTALVASANSKKRLMSDDHAVKRINNRIRNKCNTPALVLPVDYEGCGELMTAKKKTSIYEVYSKDAEARTKRNPLSQLYPSLPRKKFDIIYADPPWDYGGKMQFDKSGLTATQLAKPKKVFISAASFKYPTLKLDQLKELDVSSIAEDDCLLFMWTTSPHLTQAIELGEAWGFKYRTVAFIWNKMVHNPGQYTLSNCELVLVFKRGRIPTPRGARNVQQLLNSPRGKHSEKPIEIAEAIERMFPSQKKIELFARRKKKDWTVWGLEALQSLDEISGE